MNNNPLKYTDPTGHIFFMPLLFAGVTLAPTIIANANPIIIQVTEAMKSINRNPSPTNIAFNAADTGLNLIPSFKAVGTVGKVAEKVAAKLPVSEKIAEAIPKASKQTFHGNDLRNTAQTWGYTLRDRSTGAIKKIGETMHPDTRYSKKWLEANNVDLVHEVSGSKLEMHVWENQQLGNYLFDNLELPSLNKSLH